MKNILILGGTNFIGRHLVQELLGNSEFQLTLFNRGKTNPELFPEVNRIVGDRENSEDLKPLFLQNWDVVIDLSCYYPKGLKQILEKINPSIKNYILISSCSVYDMHYKGTLRDEKSPILPCSIEQETDTKVASYGNRKSKCETVLQSSGLPFTILRPSLVYGPYDNTDRFYYWIYQAAKREKIIVPESGERKFSITYVKDLVKTILETIESSIGNQVFNCITYPEVSIAVILNEVLKEVETEPKLINMDADFLFEKGIKQWEDIPLWLNTDDFTFSNQSLKTEFNFKPTIFENSVKTTVDYYAKLGFPEPNYGINKALQNELLKQFAENEQKHVRHK